MTRAVSLVDALKRELKARGITYAELARRIDMSEASVKRMFAQKNFTLSRFDQILQASGVDFAELTAGEGMEANLISQLTLQQEKEITADLKLLIVAVSALNQVPLENIMSEFGISEPELIKYLVRLDRIGFLQLLPNNRIKLLVSRTFRWLPHGPIQMYFQQMAANDFLAARFDGERESMQVVNVMLSDASIRIVLTRLKALAREVAQLHQQDAKLPFADRHALSCLLAARPWVPRTFVNFKRPGMQEDE
ncbi:helix-turn-helix domain-containing protein [Massilia sp. W12]|uniref:helix-turn-helix domain-containing protein n=1 Tax=Massilia sp. W12 TaxID=3126507 RepID=UPI0030CC6868